jgi:tetratricopeptide (TPR) repeat protein
MSRFVGVRTRGSRDSEDFAKQSQRNLRKGNYRQAAASLDSALRGSSDAVIEPLVSEFVAVAESVKGTQRTELVDAALTYRVAGLQITLGALNSGALETALEWADELLKRFPDDPGALTVRSLALEFQGKYGLALRTCDRLVEIASDTPEALLRRAAVRVAIANEGRQLSVNEVNANYRHAIDDYDTALELAPYLCEAYLLRGRVKVGIADFDAAAKDFALALDCDPNLLEAKFERGTVHESAGNYESALSDYNVVANEAPTVPHVHIARGRANAALGNLEEALTDFERALSLHGGLTEAYLGRARVRLELGDYAGAHTDFDVAAGIERDNPGALRGRALAAINIGATLLGSNQYEEAQGEFVEALHDCDTALGFDDHDAFAHWYRGYALRGLDGHDWAVSAFGSALEFMDEAEAANIARLRADRAESLRLWGVTAGRADKLEEAVAEFMTVAQLAHQAEDLRWTLSGRAAALSSLRRYAEAEEAFDEALARDPGSAWARIGHATVRYFRGAPDDAALELAEAAEHADSRPRDVAWASVTRALILEELGQLDRAAVSYDAALGGRVDAGAYLERGSLAEAFGSDTALTRAEADYRYVLSLEESSVDALNSLAWLYADGLGTFDRLEEATALAGTAAALAESDFARGFPLDTLGWAYHRLGRHDEAVEVLHEAHQISPHRLVRRVHLEVAREAQGVE